MALQNEKDRRKALARQIAQKAREEREASMPISPSVLQELFDVLDLKLAEGCDHSTRFAGEFLKARGLSEEPTIAWLAQHGGHCDCEILANVEDNLRW